MNEEREKLIEELLKLNLGNTNRPYNEVADFIIADRARIVEPLVNLPTRSVDYQDSMFIYASRLNEAVQQTLKRAGVK